MEKTSNVFTTRQRRTGSALSSSRIHSVSPVLKSDDLSLTWITEDGQLFSETFDLVVLSIGLQVSPETAVLCEKLGVRLDHNRFIQTGSFTPVATSRPGIYACGVISGPKDIPQSVVEASAAACCCSREVGGSPKHPDPGKGHSAKPGQWPESGPGWGFSSVTAGSI